MLRDLELRSAKLTYYLKKLVNIGVVSDSPSGYFVKDRKNIIQFLIRYRPSSLVDDVVDIWEDFGPVKKK